MTHYRCPVCDKLQRPDPTAFKVGDRVNFTVRVQRGRSVHLAKRTGKVIQVFDDTISVLYRGTLHRVDKTNATPECMPGPLSYALTGACECPQQTGNEASLSGG